MAKTSVCVGTEKHQGCGKTKKVVCRGLCATCYNKHQRTGWCEPPPLRPGQRRMASWAPGIRGGSIQSSCMACKQDVPLHGRGLCRRCYRKEHLGPIRECCACSLEVPHFALGMCKKCYMESKATLYNAKARDVRRLLGPEAQKELAAHRRIVRKARLYGLSAAQQDAMERAQAGKCAICKNDFGSGMHAFHVDHCHTTGKVRGLLCPKCNRGLGHFKDNREYMRSALCYLDNITL